MPDFQYRTIERAAGLVLVLGNAALFPGLMMFWIRGGHRGGAPPSSAYFVWERGFIIAAVVVTVIGFILLDGRLESTDARVLARMGTAAYLVAGILAVAAEALGLSLKDQSVYPLIVVYVAVAFLGQAVIGSSMLQAGVLAPWVGWAAVLWNIGWLVVLPLATPRDIYFPVLHHVAPLVIGIALLWQSP